MVAYTCIFIIQAWLSKITGSGWYGAQGSGQIGPGHGPFERSVGGRGKLECGCTDANNIYVHVWLRVQSCARVLDSMPELKPLVTSLAWRASATWPSQAVQAVHGGTAKGEQVRCVCCAMLCCGVPEVRNVTPASYLIPVCAPCPISSLRTLMRSAAQLIQATNKQVYYPACPQVEYSSQQLDLLGLGFTAVKLLFVGGGLTNAAKCVVIGALHVRCCCGRKHLVYCVSKC